MNTSAFKRRRVNDLHRAENNANLAETLKYEDATWRQELSDRLENDPEAQVHRVRLTLFFDLEFRRRIARKLAKVRFDVPYINEALNRLDHPSTLHLRSTNSCLFGWGADNNRLNCKSVKRLCDGNGVDPTTGQQVNVQKAMHVGKWLLFLFGFASYEDWRQWQIWGTDLSHLCDNHLCCNPLHLTTEKNAVNIFRTTCFRQAFDITGDRRCNNPGHDPPCMIDQSLRGKRLAQSPDTPILADTTIELKPLDLRISEDVYGPEILPQHRKATHLSPAVASLSGVEPLDRGTHRSTYTAEPRAFLRLRAA